MSGQLERCEREWHELEGEFQELQVGPGHLVPKLCYLKCRVFPFLLLRAPAVGTIKAQRLLRARPCGGGGGVLPVVCMGQPPPISQDFTFSFTLSPLPALFS